MSNMTNKEAIERLQIDRYRWTRARGDRKAIKEFVKALDKAITALSNQWVSVDDGLPEEIGEYDVVYLYDNNPTRYLQTEAFYNPVNKQFGIAAIVKYWATKRPLPEPPESEG